MSYDVIIVGLGAMGSAAAYHLAKRGLRVLGLEAQSIPHNFGSSHGHSRMIRMAYYEHPHYVPLLRRAYELWHELEAESGEKLLHITGGLYMGPPEGHVVAGALASAREHGLAHEVLSHQEIGRRFGHFALPQNFVGVLEPMAGFLLPELVISTHAALALRHGADLKAHEAVLGWSADSKGVTVTTPRGDYRAGRLLVAAGSWTSKLLTDLNVPLKVTRQPLFWIWPSNSSRWGLGKHPVWGIDHPDGSLSYGFPMMAHPPGIKVARHFPGNATDPDQVERCPLPEDAEGLRDILRRFLPREANASILSQTICMYTMSPDGHFIVDHHPNHANVTLAAGFSGHGFKFASVMGEVLAGLSTTGKTEHPASFLGLGRFRSV
jgi:sarcosine oxidase